MVILRSQNKITDFLMILAWASPFNTEIYGRKLQNYKNTNPIVVKICILLSVVQFVCVYFFHNLIFMAIFLFQIIY